MIHPHQVILAPKYICTDSTAMMPLTPFNPPYSKSDSPGLENQEVSFALATNRIKTGTRESTKLYGKATGALSFGTCTVRFSPLKLPRKAAAYLPVQLPTERKEVVDLQTSAPELFWSHIKEHVETTGSTVVFYVHGYKVSFERSCRRAALLQRALGPEVLLLLFAWPSQDSYARYNQDEILLRKSSADIGSVLSQMLLNLGERNTSIVCHSMGTRGIAWAIAELEQQDHHLFDELVIFASDMDKQEFERHLPNLRRVTSGITNYVSEKDTLLRVSRVVSGKPRVGEAGTHLELFEGVETIDITSIPLKLVYGHNYHYLNSRIIFDLRQILALGNRAAARPGLKLSARGEHPYWKMMEYK